jgi:hypothetical protein
MWSVSCCCKVNNVAMFRTFQNVFLGGVFGTNSALTEAVYAKSERGGGDECVPLYWHFSALNFSLEGGIIIKNTNVICDGNPSVLWHSM